MAMIAVTATQHQCLVGTVRTPPPTMGVEATLVVAHRLLNNPPSAHASSSATEQWHHDVDQLVVATINTLHHEGGRQELAAAHSCSPSAARALPSTRMPHQARVLPSITTVDLRDKLIRRHRGEDSRITIERHHERQHNVEGRNLERDFESLALAREAPAAHAMRPPSSPAGSGWCMVLAPHLQIVVWPRKFFWPHLLEKYNGTANPAEFLQIYSTTILAAGGDETIMANYFPVALIGTAWSWLMNLPEGTLTSWQEPCLQFTANFESAYARPCNKTDLHAVRQCLGESLRSFIQQFSQIHNIIPRISNTFVVFRQG
jgi:hypothetical protein